MKIVIVTPGSGDSFYCQNCVRDLSLARALRALGADVTLAPMYLPVDPGAGSGVRRAPLFYGAIRVYLEQMFPRLGTLWRRGFQALDARPLLAAAARRAGSTDARGLGDLTASMLRGDAGRQAAELERMIEWLREDGAPDVVHLSNALLLGLARRLRSDLGCAVVCSLQDEDVWMNAMRPDESAAVWRLLAERARDADALAAVSGHYRDRMAAKLNLDARDIRVVYPGVEPPADPSPLPMTPPVLGYYARMTPGLGLDVVVDAFLDLRRDARLSGVRLRAGGGSTSRDRPFIDALRDRLARAGAAEAATLEPEYAPGDRPAFFRGLTLMSTPARMEDGYGLHLLEAIAAGVPVVQPARGAFPEIVAMTGGGAVYDGDDAAALAEAARALLLDPDRLRALARAGREAARTRFAIAQFARETMQWYAAVARRSADNGRGANP